MANAYRVKVGDNVSYLRPGSPGSVRWTVAKVTAVNSQTSLELSIRKNDGTFTALGTVLKRTSSTETNVWRPY